MITDYYTESVSIVTEATSTGWGSEPTWGSGTTVKAAMNPTAGDERFVGGYGVAYATWKMFCSDTVAITESNRVIYGGTSYDVVFVKDTLNKGHHKVILLNDVAR